MKKWSPTLHFLSVGAGIVGFVSLIGAWTAGESGRVLGLTQTHLFSDAMIWSLVAVWIGLSTLYHRSTESVS